MPSAPGTEEDRQTEEMLTGLLLTHADEVSTQTRSELYDTLKDPSKRKNFLANHIKLTLTFPDSVISADEVKKGLDSLIDSEGVLIKGGMPKEEVVDAYLSEFRKRLLEGLN